MAHGPVVLIVLDGVGNASGDHFDADHGNARTTHPE